LWRLSALASVARPAGEIELPAGRLLLIAQVLSSSFLMLRTPVYSTGVRCCISCLACAQNFNNSVAFEGTLNVTLPFESEGLPTMVSLCAEVNSHCVPVPLVINAERSAVTVTPGLPLLSAIR